MINELIGKELTRIDQTKERLEFHCSDGAVYLMYHSQDCCETVMLEDVTGDLNDLIGSPILEAEEVVSNEHPEGYKPEYEPESFTWTFYKLGTIKGSVTLRWLGESNGYYSESVEFEKQ